MAVTNADAAGYVYRSYMHMETSSQTFSSESKYSTFDPKEPCVCSREDFIIFSEFSEITGPIPLLTLPSYIQENDEVDVNDLIMKIMSIDYQVNNTSDQFSICEDVQVLRSNVTPVLNACVHYMTLYDLRARGYVRPLCIAYFSADMEKLSTIFPKLREGFVQLSNIIRFNNLQLFLEEIMKALHDIKDAKEKYFYLKQREEGNILPLSSEEEKQLNSIDISQLAQQNAEYSHMEHVVKSYLDGETLHEYLGCWKFGLMCKGENISQVSSYLNRLKQDMLDHVEQPHLGSVLSLSPWGVAAALWKLLTLLYNHHHCRLEVSLVMFPCTMKKKNEELAPSKEVEHALSDHEYLQSLSNMACPAISQQKANSDEDSDRSPSQEAWEYLEANFLPSGTEGSGSYHSAPESISDMVSHETSVVREKIPETVQVSNSENEDDSESFVDLSDDCLSSKTWSIASDEEIEELSEPMCVWGHNIPPNVEGYNILKFFHKFNKAAHHVVYSILIGRTVVLAGREDSKCKVSRIIYALKPLVPVKDGETVNIFRWHHGILVSSHIKTNKLIGVCVPERLSVYDMISDKDKNNVTILDVTTQQLFGPAYSGKLLSGLEKVPHHHRNDQSFLLYLKSVILALQGKVVVFRHMRITKSREKLKRMNIEGCDANIVIYLNEILPPFPDSAD